MHSQFVPPLNLNIDLDTRTARLGPGSRVRGLGLCLGYVALNGSVGIRNVHVKIIGVTVSFFLQLADISETGRAPISISSSDWSSRNWGSSSWGNSLLSRSDGDESGKDESTEDHGDHGVVALWLHTN